MAVKDIPSPREFFGFEIGEDCRLARWDRIVEYFRVLGERSDRVRVEVLGETTEGNPFLLVYITSPENMKNLEKYKEISYRLANPKGLSEEEVERLIKEGKAVVAITNSLHATEVGGTQMAVELAYELAVGDDEETRRILNNVILLLFPCFNPDGQIMVVDWYNKWLGTKYEGTSPPTLYHKYVGHDNNRDAWMLTQKESKMFAKVVYKEWKPQAYIDNHHMGSYGARLYIPPWYDPICPDVDPLVWREHQLFGSYMAVRLEEEGCKGVEGGPPFTAEWTASFLNLANLLNICGMLTESASVKIATPIYIHKHQLTGNRGRIGDKKQYSYPNPWPGGWWRLKDIIKQQKTSNLAALELAAKAREVLLRNMYIKAKRNIERGLTEPPYAFIIPTDNQHDPLTTLKLIQIFLNLDVEVHRAVEPFNVNGRIYPAGTYVIFTAQPARAFIKYVLEKTRYPDNEWTRARDGTPLRPYDVASFTIPDYMGVKVDEVEEKFEGEFEKVSEVIYPKYNVNYSPNGYIISCSCNDAYAAVNRLLLSGYSVLRLLEKFSMDGYTYPAGSFYIPDQKGILEELKKVSDEYHLKITPIDFEIKAKMAKIKLLRIGIYQRYYGGNMDEGWTRWLLEQYNFPYKIIKDEDIKSGKLSEKVDLIIFADDFPAIIIGESKEAIEKAFSERFKRPFILPPIPPEYMSGIKKEGVEKLKEFVNNGGVMLAFNRSCEFAIENFKLPINNISKNLDPKKFFCPGSILRVEVDNEHPLCYGMPKRSFIFFHNSPILQIVPSFYNELFSAPITYSEADVKESGWLIGEENLYRKPALIEAKREKGKIILYAFRPQFRAQTHATFKVLFNAFYGFE